MSRHVVLAVDDSADDLSLLEMAAAKASPAIDLRTLTSGDEAIRYIRGEGIYADRARYPIPRLILLDLKMPRVTGFDVLQAFREMEVGRPPFVVVMSASKLEEDRLRAFELGATGYHMKPILFPDFCALISKIVSFFCVSTFPAADRAGANFDDVIRSTVPPRFSMQGAAWGNVPDVRGRPNATPTTPGV